MYTFEPVPDFTLDGTGKNYLSELPNEGDTEIWEIVNLTADAHPIHLHLVQFQLMNRQNFDVKKYNAAYNAAFPGGGYDPMTGRPTRRGVYPGLRPAVELQHRQCRALGGNPDIAAVSPKASPLYLKGKPIPPLAQEAGWKDTVMAYPGQVTRIVVRWAPTDFPANTPPANATFPFDPNGGHGYVWHCHIIDHEDNEMMRPDEVMPNDVRQDLRQRERLLGRTQFAEEREGRPRARPSAVFATPRHETSGLAGSQATATGASESASARRSLPPPPATRCRACRRAWSVQRCEALERARVRARARNSPSAAGIASLGPRMSLSVRGGLLGAALGEEIAAEQRARSSPRRGSRTPSRAGGAGCRATAPCAAQRQRLAVRERARRPVDDVADRTMAPTRPHSGTAPGAAASKSLSAPHSSASKCEKPT